MMNKKLIAGFLVAAAITALIFLWPSDERRIKKLFKEGVAAVESRDIDRIMSKISYNYRDDYGMTYAYLRETLRREFEKLSDIRVEHGDLHLKIFKTGDRETSGEFSTYHAILEVDVRVVATIGAETGYIVGEPKSPVRLKFTLDKERMNWRIVKTEGFPL